LVDALHGVLAEPLRARVDLPGADRAAMDGWATSGPGPWQVVGRVLAGQRPDGRGLGAGEAVEVATGALVPVGADGVVRAEDGLLRDAVLDAPGTDGRRRHVRARGEECAAGDELLPAGTPVTPAVLALAAATGHDDLVVRPPPVVAVLVTGDELQLAGVPGPERVRDALAPGLPGITTALGGRLSAVRHCGDGAAELDAALRDLGQLDCDVVVTCGMAGPGPADRLRDWLRETGAQVLVDGVRVRPGHPQLLAVLPDGRPLVGLPGNPFAAVAACLTLLQPLLTGLTRATQSRPVTAALSGWPGDSSVTTLLPVCVGPDGTATPVDFRGPAQLRGLATADAVAVVPPGHRDGRVQLLPSF
jgi:molybdopterin molybdotransferase